MNEASLSQVSNRADWIFSVEPIDDDTGDAIVLTGATIIVEMADEEGGRVLLSASTANAKVTLPATTEFQVWFPVADMRGVDPGTYFIGCTILQNDVTKQLFIGTVSIIHGIVS